MPNYCTQELMTRSQAVKRIEEYGAQAVAEDRFESADSLYSFAMFVRDKETPNVLWFLVDSQPVWIEIDD